MIGEDHVLNLVNNLIWIKRESHVKEERKEKEEGYEEYKRGDRENGKQENMEGAGDTEEGDFEKEIEKIEKGEEKEDEKKRDDRGRENWRKGEKLWLEMWAVEMKKREEERIFKNAKFEVKDP